MRANRITAIGLSLMGGITPIAGAQRIYPSKPQNVYASPSASDRQMAAKRTAVLLALLAAEARRQQQIRSLEAARAITQVHARQKGIAPSAFASMPSSSGTGIQQMLDRLNSMSSAQVNALMGAGGWWDQFTPYWLKNTPGGNVLAQFGIGNGLMGALGTRDIHRILDPQELKRIAGRLRQAQILGNIAGGQAAQNRVYNDVQKNQNYQQADKDRLEALRQLDAIVARTGLDPGLESTP
jgi:hypothetical protein